MKTRTDADDEALGKLAGNRPKRCTESRTLESPAFLDFIQRLRNNTLECDAGGKVLRLKRFISANSGPKVLHAVLDALEENTTVEALYIQGFESGFFDEHLVRLAEVLRLKRIWCLNVGENFRTSLPAWRRFCEDLRDTAVSTCRQRAPLHRHRRQAQDESRDPRDAQRDPPVTHHSLEVIMECGNMWYNPKLPKWARDIKGARPRSPSGSRRSAGFSACRNPSRGVPFREKGSSGTGSARRADGGRRRARRAESGKRKRQEKLKRERAAAKKRDDAAAALAEKNKPLAEAARAKEGGAGLVGWRVRVFWKAENAWFYGTVKTFDAASGKHAVAYDDGDEQTLTLRGPAAALGFLRAPRRKNGAKKAPSAAAEAPRPAPQRVSARVPKRRAESPRPPGGASGFARHARPRRRGGSVRRSPTRRSARDR